MKKRVHIKLNCCISFFMGMLTYSYMLLVNTMCHTLQKWERGWARKSPSPTHIFITDRPKSIVLLWFVLFLVLMSVLALSTVHCLSHVCVCVCVQIIFELRHEKTCFLHLKKTKTQISCAVTAYQCHCYCFSTARFVLDLVGIHKDRFSLDTAHLVQYTWLR